MLEPDRRQVEPSLLDPATCGEDLAQLISRMSELAPALCEGCAAYHLRFILTRYAAVEKSIGVDRPFLIERIRRILGDRGIQPPFEVVIAGAADTGILASCAHAVAAMGADIQCGTRFTIIDRCGSPLALCREFAGQHGLMVRTERADLSTIGQKFDADIIVVHSLLRFLDGPGQVALLGKLGGWLKPGGRIIVSQSIRPRNGDHRDREAGRRKSEIAMANAAIANGEIRIADPALPLLRQMAEPDELFREVPGEIASIEELRHLVAEAGLEVESMDVLSKALPLISRETFARLRVVAILKSSREI